MANTCDKKRSPNYYAQQFIRTERNKARRAKAYALSTARRALKNKAKQQDPETIKHLAKKRAARYQRSLKRKLTKSDFV